MSRNHLIPTVVVDKNNKTTTVHKRNGAPAPSASKLGSVKPKVSSAPKIAVSKVTFSAKTNGQRLVHTSSSSFMGRCGLAEEAQKLMNSSKDDLTVEMPDELLYEYLRIGIKPAEAAVIHSITGGDLDALKEDPKFADALPGDLAVTRHWGGKERKNEDITGVVDFLAEAGIQPTKISRVLSNNMSDARMKDNVLTPEQLTDLFTRYTYSVSSNEKKGTNASRLMDAVMDGRLPFGLVEKSNEIDRSIITLAVDVLYPKEKRYREHMPEDLRQAVVNDPELLIAVAKVASENKLHWSNSFKVATEAVLEFGAEACMENDPRVMVKRHADGSRLGAEGARNVKQVMNHIDFEITNDSLKGSPKAYLSSDGNSPTLTPYDSNKTINLLPEDISEMVRAGGTKEQITDLIYHKRLNTREALGVISGQTIATLADGWL